MSCSDENTQQTVSAAGVNKGLSPERNSLQSCVEWQIVYILEKNEPVRKSLPWYTKVFINIAKRTSKFNYRSNIKTILYSTQTTLQKLISVRTLSKKDRTRTTSKEGTSA